MEVFVMDSREEDDKRTKSGTSYLTHESRNDNNFSVEKENVGGRASAGVEKRVANVSDPQLAEIYAYDAGLTAKRRRKREKMKSRKKKDLEATATISRIDESGNDNNFCLEKEKVGGMTNAEEQNRVADVSDPQLAEMYAYDARLKAKRRRKREKMNSRKKKDLELTATTLSKPDEVSNDKNPAHVNIMVLRDTSDCEVNFQKTNVSNNINSTQLRKEQSGECSEKVEKDENWERNDNNIRSNGGTNGHAYVYRTKAEEYKLIEDLFKSSQRNASMTDGKSNIARVMCEKEVVLLEKFQQKAEATDNKDQTYVNFAVLPGTTNEVNSRTDLTSNKNSSQLSEEKSGECDESVKEDEKVGRSNNSIRFDGGISRDSYVYRTKAEEYEMIANFSKSPQLSGLFASNARIKSKSRKQKEKRRLKRQRLAIHSAVDGTEKNVETSDIGEIAVSANKMRQPLFVACLGQDNAGNILEAAKTTEEAKVSNGLGSSLVINGSLPVFERSKGYEETAGWGNFKKLTTIKQTEAIERETRKIFDRRDCSDVAEIIKHGNSTTDAEANISVKLGSHKGEDNLVLRKLLRSPRYFDFPISSLEMCYICGKNDHKEAECNMKRRKKPCYRCGGLWHSARNCMQCYECSKCHGLGHLARNCLEKPTGNEISEVCLRCGNSGHHMFSCHTDYSSEDLKKIQCYVCKKFGHLCCADFKYKGQTVASCYNCGQSGHFGSECIKLDRSTSSRDNSFSKCEVNGHLGSKNRESDKAGQCTGESATDDRSSMDKRIIPNFVYASPTSSALIPNEQT